MVRDSEATSPIIAHFCSTPLCKMRQSTAFHATRRNQVSAVVRQAKHSCVDRDADLEDVVADPPRLPGWSGGVETNEFPLAPRDATQTHVWSWSRFRHNFQ